MILIFVPYIYNFFFFKLAKVAGKVFVCSKVVGISKVVGTSWPSAFLGIDIKHWHATAIGMPVNLILTNGRSCALHVPISLTTDKINAVTAAGIIQALVRVRYRKFDRQTRGQCQTSCP